MAITRTASQDTTNSSATTSVTATYLATATAGNLLVAFVCDNGFGSSTTITGWTPSTSINFIGVQEITLFYKVSNGTESAITASNSGASIMAIAIYEYTGFIGTPTIDQTSSNLAGLGATSCNIGTTGLTNSANELLIAGVFITGVATSGPSWANSYTLISSLNFATTDDFYSSQQIVSATGTYTSTLSWTGSSTASGGVQATFKGSSGHDNLSLIGAG